MSHALTQKQIDGYRGEGYVIVEGVLDDATRLTMKSVLADLVEGSRQVTEHDDVYDLEPGHTAAEPRVRRIKTPHLINPVFKDFITSPKLLAILQDLLGPAIRLHGSKLNLKAPHFGSPVEWHQDWAFYPHTNDDILAVGVMLDDTTMANGAMYVIPGTHKGPVYSHHDPDGYFCGAMDPDTCGVDFSKKVACEGPAGSCSFHHVRLVHGSAQNMSDKPRGLLLYEMNAADAYPLAAGGRMGWDTLHAKLICGDDTTIPRMKEVPVRMPYPPARKQGSIYESQTLTGKRFFEFKEPAVAGITPLAKAAATV